MILNFRSSFLYLPSATITSLGDRPVFFYVVLGMELGFCLCKASTLLNELHP